MADESIAAELADLLAEFHEPGLSEEQYAKFDAYFGLFVRWNRRTNLSAIRDREGILRRHFVESIRCARCLPVEISTLLDFGSGGGLPGVPVSICRPELDVVLAESQGKKASFLREVVRVMALHARVHGGRAEALTQRFDCVTLRAVDKMDQAVRSASHLVALGGWMGLLTTERDAPGLMAAAGSLFVWETPMSLAANESRVLCLGKKQAML